MTNNPTATISETQQPPSKKQKVAQQQQQTNESTAQTPSPSSPLFTHICTKNNAPLFTELPPDYSTRDVPTFDVQLKRGMRICVLEDYVEYRKVIVDLDMNHHSSSLSPSAVENGESGNEKNETTTTTTTTANYMTGYMKAHHSGKDDAFYRRQTVAPSSSTTSIGGSSSSSSETTATKQKLTIMDQAQYDSKTETYRFNMESIGIFHSCFPEKNGTPRQGNLVPMSRGKVTLTIPQGHQAIDSLTQFEFVWLIFVFHKNTPCSVERTKIRPPRMNGNERVGMYATRTPHRPNAIGLTMATIERIDKNELFLSGVDLVDGTPILDIKPVIPRYDCAPAINAKVPEWIGEDKFVAKIERENIVWSSESREQLQRIVDSKKMRYYATMDEITEAIIQVLQTDPRPVYVRKKGMDKLYGFRIDVVNVRCSVAEKDRIEIVEIELWED